MNTRNTAGIQTTLVKGKVVVEGEHFTAVVLNPGELATADIKTGKVDIVPVNVRKYIALAVMGNISLKKRRWRRF